MNRIQRNYCNEKKHRNRSNDVNHCPHNFPPGGASVRRCKSLVHRQSYLRRVLDRPNRMFFVWERLHATLQTFFLASQPQKLNRTPS